MAFGDPTVIQSGIPDIGSVESDRQDSDSGATPKGAAYLADHPAVVKQGYGVSTAELASFVESFGDYARSRVTGVGYELYDMGGRRVFEDMTFDELVIALVEELADGQNYLAMLAVKALSMIGAVPNE